ncbi:hypothetical protein [Salipiger marinus]|uniref:Uncharacterized protein n=1 Tax=Salipiger marinus TaxID=555512 RepID=A0A1G8MSM2_9RHOB|nr:hypothetical protein [Salipiger marinus]SDI70310.1 hypothetical protein SAMN04487993_1008212 [Salipiger marinus]
MHYQRLSSLRPVMGERLRHLRGGLYVYAGITSQGTHYAQAGDGRLHALTEGAFWARDADGAHAELLEWLSLSPVPVIPVPVAVMGE